MEQPVYVLEKGTKVRTNQLHGDAGILVQPRAIGARKPNLPGVIHGIVPGHGGDVYWVRHPDNTIGAYMFTEFNLDPEQTSPDRPTRMEILRK